MKKVFMMALLVLGLGLISCDRTDKIDKEVEDALSVTTLVHVIPLRYPTSPDYYIDSIHCYDKNHNLTSTGYHYGDYQVPQEGEIEIEWHYYTNKHYYSDVVKVGNAVELTIGVDSKLVIN